MAIDAEALIARDSVETMVETFSRRVAKAKTNPDFPHSKLLHYQCMLDYFERVANAKKNGQPLAWIGLLFPPEILLAMDVVPFILDQYSIQLIAMGRGFEYFDLGEGYGFDKESCSPHLAIIGGATVGLYPEPDMIVCAGPQPCDSQSTMFDVLADMTNAPTYWVNLPYRTDDEAVLYYRQELEGLANFLSEQTGRPFNHEKLREILEYGKKTQHYFLEIQKLRNRIPSPIGCRDAFMFFGPRMGNEGTPETLAFVKAQYEEIRERVERGEGAIPDERHRIVTNGAYPFWHMQLFDWMEKEYGAVVAVDLSNSYPLEPVGDTSDPLLCLARKTIFSNVAVKTATMPYGWTAQHIGDKAKELNCDACLFFAHFGCKHGCGRQRVVVEEVRKRAGIPSLVLDIDAGNPAIVSAATMRNKVHEYFTMLEARKS